MLFQLQYYKYEPNEYFPQGQRNYYFRVSINLRGADETLYSYGECSPWEGSIFCGVDDDGGGFTIAPGGNGGSRSAGTHLSPDSAQASARMEARPARPTS